MDDVFAESFELVCRRAADEGWDILDGRRRIDALYEEMKRIDTERYLAARRAAATPPVAGSLNVVE